MKITHRLLILSILILSKQAAGYDYQSEYSDPFHSIYDGSTDNIVKNGSFEKPRLQKSTKTTRKIAGWRSVNGEKFEVQRQTNTPANDGRQYIQLNTNRSTGIRQTLKTEPGQQYLISFAIAAEPGSSKKDNRIEFGWGNHETHLIDPPTRRKKTWKTYQFIETANSRRTEIAFEDRGRSNSLGVYIDNVSVKSIGYGQQQNHGRGYHEETSKYHSRLSEIQLGSVSIHQRHRDQWTRVRFDKKFKVKPIVVLGAVTFNGKQPVTTRVRNITRRGFELMIDEWDYLDGSHKQEEVNYIAAEPGVHNFKGLQLTAQSVKLKHNWRRIEFPAPHSRYESPIVFAQIASHKGRQAATVRISDIDNRGADFKLQESEMNDDFHKREKVNIITIEKGRVSGYGGGIEANESWSNHKWTDVNFSSRFKRPMVFASLQSFYGPDTATLRYRDAHRYGFQVSVQEEKSRDAEVRHARESIGWLVVSQPKR